MFAYKYVVIVILKNINNKKIVFRTGVQNVKRISHEIKHYLNNNKCLNVIVAIDL